MLFSQAGENPGDNQSETFLGENIGSDVKVLVPDVKVLVPDVKVLVLDVKVLIPGC